MQISKLFMQSLLAAFGLVWLVLEAYYGLANTNAESRLEFWIFLVLSVVLGTSWFFLDGFLFAGHLKRSIEISSNAFDTQIKILFTDLFKQDGWKAIPVNDFFDSAVDGNHVSENSLHGIMLKRYWGGNVTDWDNKVLSSLDGVQPKESLDSRPDPGKKNRYPIGTTVTASSDGQDFLCVAIANTNTENLQVSASSENLHEALRGLLQKARSSCSGDVLNIPLIGSGLSRTGIKSNIIIDLILLAIFEESKQEKVTNEIRIILPKQFRKKIDLSTIQKDWR